MLPTIVYRHRKENKKKCSLQPLINRSDLLFYSYPDPLDIDLSSHILLTIDAPPLSMQDAKLGLLLLDGTWRYAEKMEHRVLSENPSIRKRSLPGSYRTAYPRTQTGCLDPERGLASVEALFLAYHLTGRSTEGLLDHYYWKDSFLEINKIKK